MRRVPESSLEPSQKKPAPEKRTYKIKSSIFFSNCTKEEKAYILNIVTTTAQTTAQPKGEPLRQQLAISKESTNVLRIDNLPS